MPVSKVISAAFLLLFSFSSGAKLIDEKLDSLWTQYRSGTVASEKIEALISLGRLYELAEKPQVKDSLMEIAAGIAQQMASDSLMVRVYDSYFDKGELWNMQNRPFQDSRKVLAYARNIMAIANNSRNNHWLSLAFSARAKAEAMDSKFEAAMADMQQSYYYASQLKNDSIRIKCLIDLGILQMLANKKIEAFRSFMDALYSAEKSEIQSLVYSANGRLSIFYYNTGNNDKAKAYTLKMFPRLLAANPVDSMELMYQKYNLAKILLGNDEIREARNLIMEVIEYGKRTGLSLLKTISFSLYRTYLVSHNHWKDVATLYTVQYPEELELMEATDKPLFFRMKAIIAEVKGDKAGARSYYDMAEAELLSGTAPAALLSYFYKWYGLFLWRNSETADARKKLEASLDYAVKSQYLPYQVEMTALLDSLSFGMNDLAAAYRYSKLNKALSEKMAVVNRQDEVLRLDLENEIRQRELLAERLAADTERRHNLQYMAITLLIGLTFFILIMLGSFRVPKIFIRALNFLSFIILFEFIILLIDHKVHHWTHGEPWQILAIKIVVIAILMPLHHWIEEKFIHYLSTHRLLNPMGLRQRLRKTAGWISNTFRKKPAQLAEEGIEEEIID